LPPTFPQHVSSSQTAETVLAEPQGTGSHTVITKTVLNNVTQNLRPRKHRKRPSATQRELRSLKDEVASLRTELGGVKERLERAESHCILSDAENQKLRTEINTKKTRKTRRGLNVLARVLTAPEAKEEWEKNQEEERRKKEAEAQKIQQKNDALRKREEERHQTVETKTFTSSLRSYTRKDDLKDIAACLGLEMTGTNPVITARIKEYMDLHPELKENPRFAGLFGGHQRKQKPQAVEQEQTGPGHSEVLVEGGQPGPDLQNPTEDMDFNDDSEDEYDWVMANIDPSLHHL
jgi:hypothetical protein